MTVSTVGVLKNMYRLSDELPYVNLALSLHAPNQEVRLKIVPTARAVSIEKLMEAVDYHIIKNSQFIDGVPLKSGVPEEKVSQPLPQLNSSWKNSKSNGIMIEYILIKGINDLEEHAHELGRLLMSRRGCIMLNLIPYNPTEVAEDFHPPSMDQVNLFADICIAEPYGIHTRVRHEKGQDIAGACGQLAVVNKRADEKKLGDLEDGVIMPGAAPIRSASSSPNADHEDGGADNKNGRTPSKTKANSAVFPLGKTSGAVGLKSAFLEDVLDGYKDASRLPVDSSKEGINISDNSPVQETEHTQTLIKQRATLLLYSNIFLTVAVTALTYLFARKK